jgi:anti-sigma regulatory factor (Ser/Thr protein kinase)
VDDDDVHVQVSDDGGELAWTQVRPDDLPDPEAEQGRGLFLVHELGDDVAARVEGGRTYVHVVKRAVVGRSVFDRTLG